MGLTPTFEELPPEKYTVLIPQIPFNVQSFERGIRRFFERTKFKERDEFFPTLIQYLRGPAEFYLSEVSICSKNKERLRTSIRRTTRGNRPKIAISILVADCYRALWVARGRRPQLPYEYANTGKCSECVLLAKHMHRILIGKPFAHSMQRQANNARRILADSDPPEGLRKA